MVTTKMIVINLIISSELSIPDQMGVIQRPKDGNKAGGGGMRGEEIHTRASQE
jgi:hypothetical protein